MNSLLSFRIRNITDDIIALPERPFFHFKTNRIGLTHDIEAGKFNHR